MCVLLLSVEVALISIPGESEHIPTEILTNKQTHINAQTHDMT